MALRRFIQLFLLSLCGLPLLAPAPVGAQQPPPAEPPQPMPGSDADIPTLRVTTKEVLVPTLVEKRGGGIVYGLKGDDFVVEDNGVPQKVQVQEEMDTAPVALVGFDSEPHLVRDFGHSGEDLNQDLRTMQPGDGGDAILDTISYAVDL